MTEESAVLIVDGYNLIAAMRQGSLDKEGGGGRAGTAARTAARHESLEERRDSLIESLSSYAGRTGVRVFVVFDGRQEVSEGPMHPPGVKVIFSDAPHGADQVIERLARELAKESSVYVVTGDYLQQRLIFRENIFRKPPRELIEEISARRKADSRRTKAPPGGARPSSFGNRYRLGDRLPKSVRDSLESMIRQEGESGKPQH